MSRIFPARRRPAALWALPLAALVAAPAAADLRLPESADPGDRVAVEIVPPLPDAALLLVEPIEGPVGGERVSGPPLSALPLAPGAGSAVLPLPEVAGSYRVRLEGAGRRDSAFIEVVGVPVTLHAPETVPAGGSFELRLGARAGSRLLLRPAVPGGEVLREIAVDPEVAGARSLTLRAPDLSGRYELVLEDPARLDAAGRPLVLAREAFTVEAGRSWLRAPLIAAPGERIEVELHGPSGAGHALVLVREAGGAVLAEMPLTDTGEGAVPRLMLDAPRQPGSYRLRYLSLADGEVLAEAPFVVSN